MLSWIKMSVAKVVANICGLFTWEYMLHRAKAGNYSWELQTCGLQMRLDLARMEVVVVVL